MSGSLEMASAVSFDQNEDTTTRFDVPEANQSRPVPAPKRDRCTFTMLSGAQSGAVFTMETDELVFGRGSNVSARIDDRGLSRQHARVTRREGHFVLEDLGSTNGTYANGAQVVGHHELKDGDRIQLGPNALLRFHLHDAVEQEATRRLYELAVRDGLTHAYNRRYLDERLTAEMAYAKRHGTSLSVVLVDIDHFKQINDTLGHLAGDAVLRVVAGTMQRILRTEDLVARYGGEEFCVVARGIDQRNAFIVAERLRRTVATLAIPWERRTVRVTVSCGVATFRPGRFYSDVKALLADADNALYRAKKNGRNCCEQA